MKAHNLLGPLGVALAFLVIATQVLVVYNYRNKLAEKANEAKSEARKVAKEEAFDQEDFEEEVANPLREMVNKFPDHPDMIIKKLSKQIRSEESRYATHLCRDIMKSTLSVPGSHEHQKNTPIRSSK